MEKELADVGEEAGVASGDAVLSDGGKEFAEDGIDIGGGEVFAKGSGGEERADAFRLEGLALFAGVMEAEGGVVWGAKHATAATVGEGELAARRAALAGRGGGRRKISGHRNHPDEGMG